MKIATLFAANVLTLTAFAVQASPGNSDGIIDDSPSAASMAVDLVLVRPLSLVATVLGAGLYIVQLPIALTTGDAVTPGQKLIVEPAAFTFTRPLGQMQ